MPAALDKQVYYSIKIGDKFYDVTGRKKKSGYILICVKKHPHSDRNGYVMEHRVVMESKIGRFLEKDEFIHHKNHIKHDNRIKNLQIIDAVTHTKMHHIGSKRSEEFKKAMSESAKERLKDKRNHPGYKNIDKELKEMYESGIGIYKIAEKLKVTRKTIYNKIEYLDLRRKTNE